MTTSHFNYLKYILPARRRHQAAGLTVFGQVRQRPWRMPQLGDLQGRERHAAYMRLWRTRLLNEESMKPGKTTPALLPS